MQRGADKKRAPERKKGEIRLAGWAPFRLALSGLLLFVFTGCVQQEKAALRPKVLVLKSGRIEGDPELFRRLLQGFERENPGLEVRMEALPSSTDEQHQFYVINLEGKSPDFDVLSLDVIWAPEFARAGWLRDLSSSFPERERGDFFPGPIQAVTHAGGVYAVPWYVDAGILYYRRDLLRKHGRGIPRTWPELVRTAQAVTAGEAGVYGFLWQGKQYEGLVCNVLEFFWTNGGEVLQNGRITIDQPPNVEALEFMRDLIGRYGVSPALVTTATEEPTRHIFGNGRALFMRNWPYAWQIFEREGSPLRGRVGAAPLPSFPGKSPASALGGWQLGVNRYSRNPEGAERLVRYLTSPDSQKALALAVGYAPARESLYGDPELRARQPFLAGLKDIFRQARPRPVTPFYMMITQVLQPEFSAAVSGIKPPAEALRSARRQIEHLLEVEK